MTQVFSSPGVYTQEIDQTLRSPVSGPTPGPAVVGFSKKGVAFRPVTLRDSNGFRDLFGDYTSEYYGGLAVKRFFDNANKPLSFTRVLGTGSANLGKPIFLAFPNSITTENSVFRSGNIVGAILRTVGDNTLDYRVSGTPTNFSLTASDGSVSVEGLSLNSADNGYIGNKISMNPLKTSSFEISSLYIDAVFDYEIPSLLGTIEASAGGSVGYAQGYASATGVDSFDTIAGGFSNSTTPWVVSQEFSGSVQRLFRFHTLSHGEYENSNFKVGITNVDTSSSEFPTFTVVLSTAWDSSNKSKGNKVGDQYGAWNVSLDPDSDDYISKVIGDQYIEYDMSQTPPVQNIKGEYRSRDAQTYIRVEVGDEAPAASRPSGFEGVGRIHPQGNTLNPVSSSDISFDSAADTINTAGAVDFTYINDGNTVQISGTTKTGFTATEGDGTNGAGGTVLTVNSSAGLFVGSPISDDAGLIPAGTTITNIATNDLTLSQSFVGLGGSQTINLTATNNDGSYVVDGDATATTITVVGDIPCTMPANQTDTDGAGTVTVTEIDDEFIEIPSLYYKKDHNFISGTDPDIYMGVDFDKIGTIARLKSTVTSAAGSSSADKGLLLYSKVSETTATSASMINFETVDLNSATVDAELDNYGNGLIQFSVPFFGGTDAIDPRVDRLLASNASDTTSLTGSFERAISILSNPDTFTFDILALPGIHSGGGGGLVQKAIDMVTSRQDCFYIADIASGNSTTAVGINTTLSQAITEANKFDSSFAATYYPWVKINDPIRSGAVLDVPPSVVMLGVYAINDTGGPWYAPAGFTRGALGNDIQLITKLNQSQRDTLYNNNINPLARFEGQGAAVFGQKTLQKKKSVLDRINVRRMLLRVKKTISGFARLYLFEQNDQDTRDRLLRQINDYLSTVQSAQGLTEFRAVLDETTTTPDLVDRNIMKGKIFLKPTSAAEVILFDLSVSPQGATIGE